MGRHLDAHRQRFIEQGNLLAFLAGFDEALQEDALARREDMLLFARIGAAYLPPDRWDELQALREKVLTPEELLAALEPTKPDFWLPLPVARREPLTFDAAWIALSDGMFTLWCDIAERMQQFWWLALAFVFVWILIDGFLLHW